MSVGELELLEAIRQAPDDDAPRLVYADWLLDRGNPRGEFIQLQCTRFRLPAGDMPAREALLVRERRLQAEHEDTWMGALADPMIGWRFERGFPIGFGHAGVFSSGEEHLPHYVSYLRFHPGGGVYQVSVMPSRTPSEVCEGIHRNYGSVGRYTLTVVEGAARLIFDATSTTGRVDYQGTLNGRTLRTDSQSHINGHHGKNVHTLIECSGDTRLEPTVVPGAKSESDPDYQPVPPPARKRRRRKKPAS